MSSDPSKLEKDSSNVVSPPPVHPQRDTVTQTQAGDVSEPTPPKDSSSSSPPVTTQPSNKGQRDNKGKGKASPNRSSTFFKNTFSKPNRDSAGRFFSAYAQTWVGMSPLWLMGEAITGKKVGSQFQKGTRDLTAAAHEIRNLASTSGKDIVVIIDEKIRESKEQTGKTAEVLRAAGENAVLVVTRSLDKVQSDMKDTNLGPEVKKAMAKHGRDAILVLDKALKHPLVITGVQGFAQSRGIPHADALLRLGSLALSKLIRALPEDAQEELASDIRVEELTATELERTSSVDETEEAKRVASESSGPVPELQTDPYQTMRKRNECVVM